jgi:two-component system phosphate regulon sensor histidine kinase PhoR
VEQVLNERLTQLEQVLQSIKDAVIRVDADLHVSLMNAAATKLFKAGKNYQGRSIESVAHVPVFVAILRESDKGEDTSFEFDLVRGPHTRHIRARVTQQEDGGQVIVLRDVTAVRRLERMRRDFVANVSHELRTPISVVSANSETLLEGAIDDPVFAMKLLEAVNRNAGRLTLIINDLLDLSRLEAGSYSLHKSRIYPARVAWRVRESLEEKATARQTSVHLHIDEELAVKADEAAFFQVLVNYLDNAIKYTPEGSEIEMRAERRKSKVHIEVRDNGPGIPESVANRVFERFFRVDPGRSREMGGTGLGLSIVKHLVEAMNGRVGVHNVTPQGCVFWLDLPAA